MAHSWPTIPLAVLLHRSFLNSSPYILQQTSCNPDLTLHAVSSLCFLHRLYFSERGAFYNLLLFSVVKLKCESSRHPCISVSLLVGRSRDHLWSIFPYVTFCSVLTFRRTLLFFLYCVFCSFFKSINAYVRTHIFAHIYNDLHQQLVESSCTFLHCVFLT